VGRSGRADLGLGSGAPGSVPSPHLRKPRSQLGLDATDACGDGAPAPVGAFIGGTGRTSRSRAPGGIPTRNPEAPHCGGLRELIAFLTDGLVVRKILEHLGLPTEPPRLAPARAPPEFEFAE